MSKTKNTGPAIAVMAEPEPPSHPEPIQDAPRGAVDPAAERDYWHVHYEARPYCKAGWSFGDYEPAYRYGWENAAMPEEITFEAAEKAHLERGWTAARGQSIHAWADVREAVHDAWTRARRKH